VTDALLDDVFWSFPSGGGNDKGFWGDNQDCDNKTAGLVGLDDPSRSPVPEPGTRSLCSGLAWSALPVSSAAASQPSDAQTRSIDKVTS